MGYSSLGYRVRSHARIAISLIAAAAAMLIFASQAQAAGNPNISLTKSAPASVLYGENSPVTLTASNPSGQPVGYNLSFRDVLPQGIAYVPGSSDPLAGEPQIFPNAPGPGQTTLIWSNLADVTASSSFSFGYAVSHNQGIYGVGDSYVNSAGAYVNCNPRFVPDFDGQGQPVQSGGDDDCDNVNPEESYTGSANASATTDITAIEITKIEPSPEAELLRGLHDHQTVYTLRVRNNLVNATNSADIEEYLPAQLEFLGCGGGDNTTDAPTNPGSAEEYAGSGPINPGNEPGGGAPAGCVDPDVVETVQDPAGLPTGIYTHVVWNDLTNLAPGAVLTLRYIAAIPIRANTLDWNGAGAGLGTAPAPASGLQASNLDNNAGAETNEDGAAEPSLTNTAIALGLYQDPVGGPTPVDDEDTFTVTAEDLRVLKSVSTGTFSPGGISTWSIRIDTGEYRYVDDVVVTDTLGDGYCPLGPVNNEGTPPPGEAECNPVAGQSPSVPYTSVQENVNGSYTIIWDETTDPSLSRRQPSSSYTITFPTRTRAFYQENFVDSTPVLARDAASNDVDIEGLDYRRCAPGAPDACAPGSPAEIDGDEPSGTTDADSSSAGQQAPGASIDKRVASTPNGACLGKTYVDAPPTPTSPGDVLCFSLRMDFPGTPESGSVTVTDFIPPGTTFNAGSGQATANNTVTFGTASTTAEPDVNGAQLSWPLDDGAGTVQAAEVFEVVFSVTVQRSTQTGDGDLSDNLMKAVFSNTAGISFPLRDAAAFELSQPELTLLKGVRDVDGAPPGGNPPNVDGVAVPPGSAVTYRVDVTNSGSLAATSSEIWDVLPAEVTCADVPLAQISNGGTCNVAQNRIEWAGVAVPAGGTVTLTYDVVIPDGLADGDSLDNTAGVRTYESVGGGGIFTSIPSNNIDPTLDPTANAGPASDPSNVIIAGLTVAKTRTTAVTESGNNAASQATIGERINYAVTSTIADGTTLFGPDINLTDDVGTRQTIVPGSVVATLDTDGPGGAAPVALPTAGLTLSVVGSVIRIDFPEPYANPLNSGDDIISLTFGATVDDDFPANQARGTAAQQTLPNSATLSFLDSAGTARSRSGSTSTRIVEPDIRTSKSNNAAGPVSPGDIVTFTVNASNLGPVTGTSVAHDVLIVDTLPIGVTPVNGGVPVGDGGAVNPNGGIWNATARTITWTQALLNPGAATARTYDAVVDNNAIGAGSLTNTVRVTTSSLAGAVPGERTAASTGPAPGTPPPGYQAAATSTLALTAAAVVKVSSPSSRTIGDVVTHTITVTVPPQIQQFDAVVVDDLPDGFAFDSYVSAACTAGCAPGPTQVTPVTLTPVANGTGTRIGWSLGDIASAGVARTIQLVYRTHIEDTYSGGVPVSDGDSLTNTATLAFNTTNDPGPPPTTPPDPNTFDQQRTDTAQTDVVEPLLVIDKDVSGDPDDDDLRTAQPGDSFTYSLKVTNNGTAPAYDVRVTDQPDVELTNVVATTGSGLQTDAWTAADPDMVWVIPGPIQPNQTVTLSYTADLVPSAQLADDQQVVNTADIPSYWGVPQAERTTNGFTYREYDNVTPDTVTITVQVPALQMVKTTAAAGFPDSAAASIENPFPWRVVVTNPNAGSSLFGVDLVDQLPANWTYVPGSAQVTGTGALTPGGQVEPAITTSTSGQRLEWLNLANLDGAETVIISFQATPQPRAAIDPGSGAANPNVNNATASGVDSSGAGGSSAGPYSGSDPAQAVLATPTFDLTVTKSASRPTPPAGTEFDWIVTVTNNGPDAAPSVTMTDTLPTGTTFVSATPQAGTCANSGQVVTCDLGTMASGRQIQIVIRSKIARSAAGQTLTNGAMVADPSGTEPDTTNNSATATVTAGPFAAGIAESCTGGRITLDPKKFFAGVPTQVTTTVTGANGMPTEGAPVTIQSQRGGQVSATTLARETNAQGQATFTLEGPAGARWTASVNDCSLSATITVSRSKSCRDFQLTPRTLTAGRTTRLRVRLRTADGDPIRRITVTARGAGDTAEARTDKAGRATLPFRPTTTGIVKVSAPDGTSCVARLGVAAGGTAGAGAGDQLTG